MTDIEPNIFVSDKAVKVVKKQLEKRGTPNGSLRLGIKGSGCNGYTYVIQFEDAPAHTRDLVFNFDDLQVLVDPKSAIYLNGCTLDWEQTLLKQGFKFVNPNEKETCGCGHSFSV
jgi:iron-sulfur cluster assembly protein